MINISAQNSTYALVNALRLIMEQDNVPSRAGLTKELCGVNIEITNPLERCFILPHRNDNIFAKIAETIWVLAGRNDIGWLSFYLPRAKDFSDDGKTWRAGYGPRLRNFTGVIDLSSSDQLMNIAKLLKDDPTTRRAVISLWDPGVDCCDSKDIPCLSGDTILESPEGNRSLCQLAQDFETGTIDKWPVYSFDCNSKAMVITWCKKVWKSGSKRVMKLNFDDGTSLICTPNHKLYFKVFHNSNICKEIQAKDITIGERVWASKLWMDSNGYIEFKLNLAIGTARSNMQKVHRAYYKLMHGDEPEVVHHVDEITSNNHAGNLFGMAYTEHDSYHRTKNNPMLTMTKSQRAAKGHEHSNAMKEYWNNAEPDRLMQQTEIGNARISSRGDKGRFTSNHKVIGIEYLPNKIDVYDFEVDDYHNAMLDNGVFVHNCNNWLHFLIRGGQLNLYVAQRSCDAIWGFSGINAFEWATLMQFMAHWTGTQVGTLTFHISSMHVYEQHWKRANDMLKEFKGVTIYDYGVKPAGGFVNGAYVGIPMTPDMLDKNLELIFNLENGARMATSILPWDIGGNDLINNCLDMLAIYCYYKKPNMELPKLRSYLMALPDNDFKMAALEYFHRTKPGVITDEDMEEWQYLVPLKNVLGW